MTLQIIKTEMGTAKVLNTFCSNIVQNLYIQQRHGDDLICENMNEPLLRATLKVLNFPST